MVMKFCSRSPINIYITQQTSHQLKHQPRSGQEPSLRRKIRRQVLAWARWPTVRV